MTIFPYQYYHIYNRTNNNELAFRSNENFLYFLKKYRNYFDHLLNTIGYCLMPTHFHFLAYVKSEDIGLIKSNVGVWLSSYSRSMNSIYGRHGSLFQQHTKAKHIDDESYLINVLTYIHQNPIRKNLVDKLEAWEYSSYRDYIELRDGTLPDRTIMNELFPSTDDFRKFSETLIESIDKKYWI